MRFAYISVYLFMFLLVFLSLKTRGYMYDMVMRILKKRPNSKNWEFCDIVPTDIVYGSGW